ncbi:uncharacterized protein [Branchiostoma lanceolatum]|uniref:uncharacterized protein n=1 Tax=Branchiostoma lanceolatum TaxID=7740 RepID=UPI003452F189
MICPRASGMLYFQISLVAFSLVGGTSSFNTIVFVPENARVGTTVAHHSASQQLGETYRLLAGNDYERFRIAGSQGVIKVANPLDYQIQSTYQLQILIGIGRDFAENTTLWNLTVHVLDVSGYPPYYNKTCETPERSSGIPRLVELTNYLLNISTSTGIKITDTTDIVNVKKRSVYFSLANDKCKVNMTVGIHHLQDVANAHVFFKAGFNYLYSGEGDNNVSVILIDRSITRDQGYQEVVAPMMFSELVASKSFNPIWIDDERYRYFLFFRLGALKTATPVTSKVTLTNIMASSPYGKGNFTINITFRLAGCPHGKYGAYCDKNCTCKNDARCHGFNGACLCAPGWKGVACDIPTPAVAIDVRPEGNMYITGNISLQCRSVHVNVTSLTWWFQSSRNNSSKVFIQTSPNFSISPILPETNGVYTCEAGTPVGQTLETNYVLEVTECPPGLHGKRCDRLCDCLHDVGCDRWTGCVCEAGWTGPTCDTSCSSGKFGTNCEQQCRCENGAECNPFNGTCICPPDRKGEYCEGKQRSTVKTAHKTSLYLTMLVFTLPVVVVIFACIVKRRKRKSLRKQGQEPVHEELQPLGVNQQLNLAASLIPWERDPRHLTLGDLVGIGTFGHVVEGTFQIPGELPVKVAIKTVYPEVNQDNVNADFCREMDILVHLFDKSLHKQEDEKVMHPNIVQLYGVVTLTDPKRIILEFAPHGNLQTYLTRLRVNTNAVNWATLLGFAVDVSKALQELERVKIVHRDVAARNVVITDQMVAKLSDFGLARDVYTNTVYERTNHHGRDELLPLKWMALESLRDGSYTCQSDVWSFGVMLWEIASLGEEPRYPGPFRPNCCQMVKILRQGNRMEKPEQCSIDLYRLMCQCWCSAPDHRPTAAQLEERLAELVDEIEDVIVDYLTQWETTV